MEPMERDDLILDMAISSSKKQTPVALNSWGWINMALQAPLIWSASPRPLTLAYPAIIVSLSDYVTSMSSFKVMKFLRGFT